MNGVTLVLGPERFLAREAVADLIREHADLDLTRYQGGEVKLGAVLDDARTPTLFGKARLIVVEDAAELFGEGGLDALLAYAGRPAPGSLLVLVARNVDGRTKAGKALKAACRVIDCQPMPERDVGGWIVQRARSVYGMQAGGDAVRALRQRVGDELGELDTCLKRLCQQIAPRHRLTEQDVAESTEEHRSPLIFEAANALEAGDLQAALGALAGAFSEGIRVNQDLVTDWPAVAPILLANLHRTYTRLLRYHMLRRAGEGPDEAARDAGVSPRATRYFLPRATRHRLGDLVARHRHFVKADMSLKRGGKPLQTLESLLMGLLR